MHPYPTYPLPAATLLRLLWAVARQSRLSFRQEACACVKRLSPPLTILTPPHAVEGGEADGQEESPTRPGDALHPSDPYLVTVNHYNRPGFQSWWISLAVSAALPVDIHWVVTSAWRNFRIGRVQSSLVSTAVFKISSRLFPRMAQVYGFTAMPPMPPEPAETEARAAAVRSLLAYARNYPQSVIGLAPEGHDSPDGRLMLPPPGVGRLVHHLCRSGRLVLPAGLYEIDGRLCLCLGAPYSLKTPSSLNPTELDLYVRQQVMAKIAGLLPDTLGGPFA